MARPNDTRDRLIQAAIDLIESSSFGAVGVEQICERAGVHKGSFYHYFPSKVDLALEAFEVAWSLHSKPLFERHFAVDVPPLERLTGILAEFHELEVQSFEATGHVRGCPFCTVGSEMANVDPRLRVKADELLERDLVHIERALRDAHRAGLVPHADFKDKARAIAALVLGSKLQAKLSNDPNVLKRLGAQVMDFVGARAEPIHRARPVRGSSGPRTTPRASPRARASPPAPALKLTPKSTSSRSAPAARDRKRRAGGSA